MRAYKRSHPGITLDQARQAVAARSAAPVLPARIPGAPLPHPAERLEGYVQRVAAAIGVQRHRAMELLGLQPGTSATDRLDHLAAAPLPDDTVQALTAVTGMTAEQARALTAPRARPDLETVRRITEHNFAAGHYHRGGEGKTTTSGTLSGALSLHFAERARMIDLDTQDTRDQPEGTYSAALVDVPWPIDERRPPVPPELFDAITKALDMTPETDTDTQPHP
ncbi:hypothetical protein C9F11_42785 (plasmid) [Streptomyces sp. YIM 121038]|uniref:TniQ family protein n=1 Tax=Streptomyces sp. YIM 121038 TaxID=2136401 RepID=UPI0011657E37|nr:TniQ family protein [Streptomyces sp. YIM 121038]QCX82137.1 hypothetical protein C9F11_42785 [Streptomyces sp. YIM 121038]